ncbi:SusC/RagA family TonB-linked outer membrane protein [Chitinophaga pendula]|nr:SusC/RagA family TonB-linked outer membrane protein [Chitinophaga pendula]ASZ15040.1 SusC/RagA family TonB-linked outer membrane protein [Chitinophaga sp. MD30]UCJ09118.1 SusC/RagA family TonB-linked outer membrane protein [Chitinophaga pendula]
MKLTTAFILIACLKLSATGIAQNVTISFRNSSLENAIREVRRQTGYNILYTSELMKTSKPISLDVKDLPINQFLDKCLIDQPITYHYIEDKIIVLKPLVSSSVNNTEIAEPEVKGSVVDENLQPLAGVSVKNVTNGVIAVTDAKGQFSIKGSAGNMLEFTFVGFRKQRYRIAKTNTKDDATQTHSQILIQLSIEPTELSGSVVIGYGTAKRKDLTGSVASVSAAEIKNVPFTSVDQALSGKAAGVQIVQADGSPGGVAKIRIRGGASLMGTNDPLYIIDGVPMLNQNNYQKNAVEIVNPVETYSGDNMNSSVSGAFARGLNSLAGLNINDIETIDILKDASATAIYGSKAANGVVIITTKRGKFNQKPVLEGNYYTGLSTPLKEKVLNAQQYISIVKEAVQTLITERARLGEPPSNNLQSIINNPDFFGKANTDWLGLVLRNGFTQNADISVRGGGNGSRYFTSLAYTKQEGVLIATDFSRVSGKLNLDNEITKRLRLQTNMDFGFTTNNLTNGVYGQAMFAPPTESPYDQFGAYSTLGRLSTAYQGFQNPLALASGINRTKSTILLGSIALDYDIHKDLRFRSVVSINYNNYNQLNYVPSYVDIGGVLGRESSGGGTGSEATSTSINSFFENTLSYNKSFNDNHRINAVLGTSWEKFTKKEFSAIGKGYPDDDFLNNLNSAAIPVAVKGSDPSSQYALLSFYLRANYTLKDKIIFTFTGRSDASSKFAKRNQVGYFPSGAIAYRISEENFLKNLKWLDELKFRVSAGKTGLQTSRENLWRTLFAPVSYNNKNAFIPSQLGNESLKWESSLQKDIGLDFSMFAGRLRGTLGLYEKTTDGLLLPVSTPYSSSFSSVILNIAKVRNRGFEIDVRGDIIRRKKFQWNVAVNLSSNVSKVLNINGGPFSDPQNRNARLNTSIIKEGEPYGLLYGTIATGIIKTKEQLEAYKKDSPDWQAYNPYLNIGDMSYKFIRDRREEDVIGNANPKFYGGITNTFGYGNLNLITLLTYSVGNKLIYQNDVSAMSIDNLANRSIRILDRYNADNTNSTRPRLIFPIPNPLSQENVYDASYLKLRSVTLAYNVPQKLLERIRFKSASVYFTGTNLFTLTKYPGLDPEVSDNPGSIVGGGRDISAFPSVRMYVAGLRFGL